MANFLGRMTARRLASRLAYNEFGVPSQVVTLETFEDPKVEHPEEVVAKVLAVPVHPSHINTIQGTYPVKVSFPAIGGGEAIARVTEVGSNVKSVSPGNLVYPEHGVTGTWSTHIKGRQTDFERVFHPDIDVIAASVLRVNPGTAYRMLHDFADLRPGDLVVQNGSNSSVGQAVIQIAKAMGVKTANVIRERPDIGKLKEELISLGADMVFTESELRSSRDLVKGAKLALNCTGGSSSTEIARCLGHKGVHVTYGGMSLKPVTAATSSLIFKDISFRGFWMSRWAKENQGSLQIKAMYRYLEEATLSGKLRPSKHTLVSLKDYEKVLQDSMKGFKNGKYIFDLRDEP